MDPHRRRAGLGPAPGGRFRRAGARGPPAVLALLSADDRVGPGTDKLGYSRCGHLVC